MLRTRPFIRTLTVALAALAPLLGGCFEDPVEEVLVIELHPEDRATVTARVELLPISREENLAAWRRVDHYRSILLDEIDPWTRRFAALRPLSETYHWDKSDGELRVVERSALIDARELNLFFADSGVSVFLTGDGDWRELSIYPGESTRATREQRALLESRTDRWTEALSSYFVALGSLYDYLDDHHDRERAVFIQVFRELVSDEELDAAGELSEGEITLVEDLRSAMEAAWKILEVDPDDAYSLNEISYLVHDPFPSDVEIVVPVEPFEVEGFEHDDGRFFIRRTGLWEAFEMLESKWATPDLLTIWIDAALDSTGVEIDPIIAVPRSLETAPSAHEIETALEQSLRPLSVYRLRWREN